MCVSLGILNMYLYTYIHTSTIQRQVPSVTCQPLMPLHAKPHPMSSNWPHFFHLGHGFYQPDLHKNCIVPWSIVSVQHQLISKKKTTHSHPFLMHNFSPA